MDGKGLVSKICKQILSPPKPYEKIQGIYFLRSVSISNCISIQSSVFLFRLAFCFLLFCLIVYISVHMSLIFASLVRYSLLHFLLSHMAVHHHLLHHLHYHHLHLLLLAQSLILKLRLGFSANHFLHRPFPFLTD